MADFVTVEQSHASCYPLFPFFVLSYANRLPGHSCIFNADDSAICILVSLSGKK